jgi:protein phosphatase
LRRWPVATATIALLALLVLLVGGGGFGFWRYDQSQYYVGVGRGGYVAIYRGTDQDLAGISLSSVAQRSDLKAGELRSGDQAALSQTIAQGSVGDARLLIDELASQVTECRQQWQAVAAWSQASAAYHATLAKAAKAKAPAGRGPGPQPAAPRAEDCAPAAALGVTIPGVHSHPVVTAAVSGERRR